MGVNTVTLNYYVWLLKHAKPLQDKTPQERRKEAIRLATTFPIPGGRAERILQKSTITRASNIEASIANDLIFMALVLHTQSLSEP